MNWKKDLKDPYVIQAAIAAALSFSHIHDLAEMMGQTGWRAWAYPVSVDLLMLMSLKRLRTPDAPKVGPWTWFLLSMAASMGANVAVADTGSWVSITVAGWPVVAFLGGSLMVHTRQVAEVEEPQEEEHQEEVEPEQQLMTVSQAANASGVPSSTLQTWLWRKEIPVVRREGKVRIIDLLAVEEHKKKARRRVSA